ncbi:inovirus-type Gp2 protein [Atlantibacter subterranea]|uniref:Inovirus-type Gp2 protein n=1 Tax=Atlantibacter subterraneus TaxID=255519 RepID=A0ABU4DYY7_9ENTR|nr:inovirus-type Gp2 protein [Atlantibacter subterranea]MDV7022059.1 inovirus-type Gp2 protein [Atlantibacter subterranea]MDZ5665596.1 inovirus-type Gp2 protein [Atlantibacter hermannii]
MDLSELFLLSHAEYHIENNTPYLTISDDNEFRFRLEQLDSCLKTISRGRKLPFTVLYNRSGYKENAESVIILDAIRYLNMLPQEAMKVRIANPRIATFQNLFNNADLYTRVYNGKIVRADTVTTAEMLNKLVQDYRFAASQAGFKQTYRKYQRASVKNLKGVMNYIRHLQERHSRLLVLRVDLSWANEHKADITADDARKYRQQLFRSMQKNPLFRHVLGTVWKLEYAPQRKFHYHMLFILNGNKAQQDGVIAHAFGEYWKHTITKGKGIYYNCNANKARYEDCCLGKLERGDSSKDKGLLKALSYITKIDACARLVLPGNARTFGRGEVRSLKNKKRTKRSG